MRAEGTRGRNDGDASPDVLRRRQEAYDRQMAEARARDLEEDHADAADFFRRTGIGADYGDRQITLRTGVVFRAGMRNPIEEIAKARRELGRDLSRFELFVLLEPTPEELKRGGEDDTRFRDVLACLGIFPDAPEPERAGTEVAGEG